MYVDTHALNHAYNAPQTSTHTHTYTHTHVHMAATEGQARAAEGAAPSSPVLRVAPEYEYNHLVVVADGEGKKVRETLGGRFLMEEGLWGGSESEEAAEGE